MPRPVLRTGLGTFKRPGAWDESAAEALLALFGDDSEVLEFDTQGKLVRDTRRFVMSLTGEVIDRRKQR